MPYEDQFDGVMLLRDSQVKFHSPDDKKLTLAIVSTNDTSHSCIFFTALIKALEDSDTSEENETAKRIEMIYQESYRKLASVSIDGLELLEEIFQVKHNDADVSRDTRSILLKLAIRLKGDNIYPEGYLYSFLALYLASLAEWTRMSNPFKIPIPGSHCNLGLSDEYEILEDGEVFIRAQGLTISGDVLVYRFPILHIADIQQAKALPDSVVEERMKRAYPEDCEDRYAALTGMNNVIFFSLKDDPPFPSRLSGGDLDGDHFEILTEKCGFWDPGYYAPSEFQKYDDDAREVPDHNSPSDGKQCQLGVEEVPSRIKGLPQDPIDELKSFDIGNLAEFMGQYVRYDCFDELDAIFMRLADKRPTGMKDKDVQKWPDGYPKP
jgi:hypothetical protein